MADAAPVTPPSAPGLINTGATGGPQVTGYTPSQATPVNPTPAPYTVTPQQTVAGQIKGLIDEGSPLMQQAEARSRAQMNARGLINSSQAITAGQSAVLGAVTPIATSDAAVYERAATNTTGAQNTAELQKSQLGTQTAQFNTGQENAALSQATTAANTVGLTELQAKNQQALQALIGSQQLQNIDAQGKIQVQLQQMTDNNKLVLQTSANAGQYYNTMLQYMSAITTNPNMTHDQKANALNNAVTQLNDELDTMTALVGIPGVQSTLSFSDANMGGVSPSTTVTGPGGAQISVPLNPSISE